MARNLATRDWMHRNALRATLSNPIFASLSRPSRQIEIIDPTGGLNHNI
jgi:hypothetical protein